MQRLLELFEIEEGEERTVGLVLAYAVWLFISNVLAKTASYALFLDAFDAQSLPLAYIAIAVAAPLASTIYLRLASRYSLSAVLLGVHGFILVSLLLVWAGLGLSAAAGLIFILPVFYGVINSLGTSSFWNLLGRIYNLQQGKRLFGLLGSGEPVATILAGLAAPLLIVRLGTASLFFFSAAAVAVALLVLIVLSHRNRSKLAASSGKRATRAGQDQESPFADGYVRLIFAVSALFIIGVFFVENIYYAQLELFFSDPDALASFISLFFAAFGALSLIVQWFFAGRLITRYGVKVIVLGTPLGLLLGIGLFAAVGTFTPWMIALFWIIAASNMYRLVLDGVDSAVMNIMYQPLPAHQRTQGQTVMIGIIYPVAIGVAGVLLLILINGLGMDSIQLSYALLVIIFIWLAFDFSLLRAYPRRLQRALQRRELARSGAFTPDLSSMAALEEALATTQPATVIYAMQMLAQFRPQRLRQHLPRLLAHADREVRLQALQHVIQFESVWAAARLRERIEEEDDPEIRTQALRLLGQVDASAAAVVGGDLLDEAEAGLRMQALAAVLSGGQPAPAGAETLLAEMARSENPARRIDAAEVIGSTAIAGHAHLLSTLLQDPDHEVRLAAMSVAGDAGFSASWPHIIGELDRPPTRAAAARALLAGGEKVVPYLRLALEEPDVPEHRIIELARICGRIGSRQAIPALRPLIEHPRQPVRAASLEALIRCGYKVGPGERPQIDAAAEAELQRAAEVVVALHDCGDERSTILLRAALKQELTGLTHNVFRLLALQQDQQAGLRAWQMLRPGSLAGEEPRAYAREVLEVSLDHRLRKRLFALLDQSDPATQLVTLPTYGDGQALSLRDRLLRLFENMALDDWTIACTIQAGSDLFQHDREVMHAITHVADGRRDSAVVAETAALAQRRLAAALKEAADDSPRLQPETTGAQTEAWTWAAERPLPIIEQVLILRRIAIFSNTPDAALAQLAGLTSAVHLPEGRTLFHKGDEGDSLYIVVSGKLRLHDKERQLAIVDAREVFGEMALLDDLPRSGSVTAALDCELLRLDSKPFYRLLNERPDVMREIMTVLSRRLRRRLGDMNGEQPASGVVAAPGLVNRQATIISFDGGEQWPAIRKRLLLQEVNLLSAIDADVLDKLAGQLNDVHLSAGQNLFQKGQMGDGLYIVAEGSVRVHDGPRPLATLGPGDAVGEMALLDDAPRVASVTAVTPAHLLRLDPALFFEMLEDYPQFGRGLIRLLARSLRERMAELSQS